MIIPSGEKLPDDALEKYLKISKNLVKVFTIGYSEYTCYFFNYCCYECAWYSRFKLGIQTLLFFSIVEKFF